MSHNDVGFGAEVDSCSGEFCPVSFLKLICSQRLQPSAPDAIVVNLAAHREGAMSDFAEAMLLVKALCFLVVVEHRQVELGGPALFRG